MILSCPACTHLLNETYSGSLTTQVCATGCGGIWLASQDIQSLTKTPRMVDRMLAATGHVTPLRHSAPRQCPSCHVGLEAWNVSGGAEVEIDLCPTCQGLWLDQGEVATLVLLHRKGNPQQQRKQPVTHSDASGTEAIGDLAVAALYIPDLTIAAIDMAGAASELSAVAIEAVPAAVEVAGAVAEGAGAVVEVAGAVVEGAGTVVEAAGAVGEVIGGLFELLSIFG
ncbi:MAG TPA: zf-TFIIB domain-containing protein [Candidatus Obscuribacterales bacterium]